MSSYKEETTTNPQREEKTKNDEDRYIEDDNLDGFRLSRHSDRHPARTPSPTKAAYLRTGISGSAKRDLDPAIAQVELKQENPPEIIVTDMQEPEKSPKKLISAQKQVRINEFLFGINVSIVKKIKPSLHSQYEACNDWRGPSPRLSAWVTQIRKNLAAVASR